MEKLQPCHIQLRRGGTSPLTSLQHYNPDRLTGQPAFLKHLDQPALWIPEPEQHIVTSTLFLHLHESGAPEREVMTITEANQLISHLRSVGRVRLYTKHDRKETLYRTGLNQLPDKLHLHHAFRKPLNRDNEIRNLNADTLTYGAFSRNRVELRIHDLVAPVILLQEINNQAKPPLYFIRQIHLPPNNYASGHSSHCECGAQTP